MSETFEFKSGYSYSYLILNLLFVGVIITICVGNIVNYNQTLDDPTNTNTGWLWTLIIMNSILLIFAVGYIAWYAVIFYRNRNQTLDTKVEELMKVINPKKEPSIKIDEKSLNSIAINKLSDISDGDDKLAFKILSRAVQKQKERIIGLNEEGEVIFESLDNEDFKDKLKSRFKQYSDEELEEKRQEKMTKDIEKNIKKEEVELKRRQKFIDDQAKKASSLMAKEFKLEQDKKDLEDKINFLKQKLDFEELGREQAGELKAELSRLNRIKDLQNVDIANEKRNAKIEESKRKILRKLKNGDSELNALSEVKAEAEANGDSVEVVDVAGAELGIFQRGVNAAKASLSKWYQWFKSIGASDEEAEVASEVAEQTVNSGGSVEEAVADGIEMVNIKNGKNLFDEFYRESSLSNNLKDRVKALRTTRGSLISRGGGKYSGAEYESKYGTPGNLDIYNYDPKQFSIASA